MTETHTLNELGDVVRDSDGAVIPADPKNRDYAAWVAAGSVAAPYVAPARNVQAEIDALEQVQLMPRATREFMLLFMAGTYTPEQLAANLGFVRLKAFDDQIAALRALL
jgi:hypothetical protein